MLAPFFFHILTRWEKTGLTSIGRNIIKKAVTVNKVAETKTELPRQKISKWINHTDFLQLRMEGGRGEGTKSKVSVRGTHLPVSGSIGTFARSGCSGDLDDRGNNTSNTVEATGEGVTSSTMRSGENLYMKMK